MSIWWWMGGDNSGNMCIWGLERKEVKNFDKWPQINKSNEYLWNFLFHLTSQLLKSVNNPLFQTYSSFRVSETAYYSFFLPTCQTVTLLAFFSMQTLFLRALHFEVSWDSVPEFFFLHYLLEQHSLHPSYSLHHDRSHMYKPQTSILNHSLILQTVSIAPFWYLRVLNIKTLRKDLIIFLCLK